MSAHRNGGYDNETQVLDELLGRGKGDADMLFYYPGEQPVVIDSDTAYIQLLELADKIWCSYHSY